MKPLLIITGPTASGKSSLALGLAKELNTEIISADSMQIYKYMDIGTAKPDASQRREVRHHLIDITEPGGEFSSFLFKQKTEEALEAFNKRGLIPLIAGGTGFYLKNLLYSFDFQDTEKSGARERLTQKLADEGKDALYAELVSTDEESARRLHPNDVKRVMRALEIFYECGVKKSQGKNDSAPRYAHLIFVLDLERKTLYERIGRRVDSMMRQGLLDEVKSLIGMGVPSAAQSMQAIGYKELAAHLNGEYPLETAVELIKQHTRNYAKRQITYFKKLENAVWLDAAADERVLINTVKAAYFGRFA